MAVILNRGTFCPPTPTPGTFIKVWSHFWLSQLESATDI